MGRRQRQRENRKASRRVMRILNPARPDPRASFADWIAKTRETRRWSATRRRRRGRRARNRTILGYLSSNPLEEIHARNSDARKGERGRFIRLGQLGMSAVRSQYARYTITVSCGNESTETTAKSVKRCPPLPLSLFLTFYQESHVRHRTRDMRFLQADEHRCARASSSSPSSSTSTWLQPSYRTIVTYGSTATLSRGVGDNTLIDRRGCGFNYRPDNGSTRLGKWSPRYARQT